MFEHVLLRRAVGGSPISAGQIAEALFYYQKVHLFLEVGTLLSLFAQLSPGQVLALISRHDVSAVYCEEMLGTHTEGVGVSQAHNYVAFSFTGNQTNSNIKHPAERLQMRLEAGGIQRKDAKNFAKHFFNKVPIKKLSGNYFTDGGVTVAAQRDLLDVEFLKRAVRCAISTIDGGYDLGDAYSFDIVSTGLGNFVTTDIDFEGINRRRTLSNPGTNDVIGVAHILSQILDARADLALASHYGGDFVTSSVTSSIIQARHSEFLRRSSLNVDAQRAFTEIHLPDAPSIAEVIDSGEREFGEFMKLLDQAERFKTWMKSVNPDEGLVRTYIRDISREACVQSIKSKGIRYILSTGLGLHGAWTGAIAGFVDTFLVENFLGGWRPNHFVNTKLVPFVKGYKP